MNFLPGRDAFVTRNFAELLWSGNLLVAIILVISATWTLKSSREAFTARAQQSAENLAEAYALGIESDIRLIDHALQTAVEEADAPASEGRNDAARIDAIGRARQALLPRVDVFRLTDEFGTVLGASTPVVAVADRGYFQRARAYPDRLAVSEPLHERTQHRQGLIFARARKGVDGQFGGVALASLRSQYFVEKFKQVDIGPQGAVTLRSASYQLIARYTPGEAMPDSLVGTQSVSSELRQAMAEHPEQGVFVSRTAIDRVERVNAYRRVAEYPLIVLVGIGTQDFLAPWKRQVVEVIALSSLLGSLVLALSFLAHVTHRRHVAARQEQMAMLDNDLVGMVRLRDRRVLWHNAALSRMFGYEGDALVGRSTRILYPDEGAYERIGLAYAHMEREGPFRTEVQMRRVDGQLLWIDLSGVKISRDESLWMMVDVTAAKNSEAEARYRAVHDPLTGLFNRAGVDDAVAALHGSSRRSGGLVAVCFIDLDGFKQVNDVHGHRAGDRLLEEAARRISACTRAGDVVARVGGDEFLAAIGHLAHTAELQPAVDRLVGVLAMPFEVDDGVSARVSASIGVAWMAPDRCNTADVIVGADRAMYVAKRQGKNRSVTDVDSLQEITSMKRTSSEGANGGAS